MCISFILMRERNLLEQELGLEDIPAELLIPERFFPAKGIPVLWSPGQRQLDFFYWGLIPPWAKDISIAKHTFNARAETLAEKPAFKNAFLRRRCLIPASGYYEFKRAGEGRVPYLFSLTDQPYFTLGGLWEYWMDKEGNEVYSATVITCPANERAAAIHDRMPVIIDRKDRRDWLAGAPLGEIQRMLRRFDAAQMRWEVA